MTRTVAHRVSSKQTKINFGSNRNQPKQDLFRVCFGLFRETKIKNFGLFRCFEPISKQPKQTELFGNKPKQTETSLNFLINTQIYSLLNCLGGSSVCFGSIETSKLSVSVKKRNNRNKRFRNKPKKTKKNEKTKKTEKNRKNPKFSVKNTSIQGTFIWVLYWQHLGVASSVYHYYYCGFFICHSLAPGCFLLLIPLLRRYRSETTETNVLFRIVPKLVSVPVSVVSNRN